MMCSARSLGCATSAAASGASSPGRRVRGRVPAMGRVSTSRPLTRSSRSGRGTQHAHAVPLHQRGERRRIARPQPLVQQRRIQRLRVRLRAGCRRRPHAPGTRQVCLIDVAGANVLLGTQHPLRYTKRGSSSVTSNGELRPVGCGHRRDAADSPSRCASATTCSSRLSAPASATAQTASALQHMHQRAGRAQRKGRPGQRCRRQGQMRFDVRGDLIAQVHHPARREGHAGLAGHM